MPFNWTISISPGETEPPKAQFDPNPLTQVAPGDQVIWSNNDTVAHWPGLLTGDGSIIETYFMPNQIAPNSTSDGFAAGADEVLHYACSLHPEEKGTIHVQG